MANEMRKTAVIVSMLVILVAAPHASMATEELNVTVDGRSSRGDPVGAGFGRWEGAEVLQVHLEAPGSQEIASATPYLDEGQIWYEIDGAPDPWSFEAAAVRADDVFAVMFDGMLTSGGGGGGGGGAAQDWGAAVSDVDIDCDSDNDSIEKFRPPSSNAGEDDVEFVDGDSGTSPPVMFMRAVEHWADIEVNGHVKRKSYVSIQISEDYASRFILAKKGADGKRTVLEKIEFPITTKLPDCIVMDEFLVETHGEGDPGWWYSIRPSAVATEEDEEFMQVSAVVEPYGDPGSSGPQYKRLAVDTVSIKRIPEDEDTNRDDLVNVGDDITSFGPDSGTITYQAERDEPQVYLPLATARWNQLAVKAYLAQGAFQYQRNKYWQPTGGSEDGLWQAYSLHSRARLACLIEDEGKELKRVEVWRPRGNVVTFDFEWDDTASQFKPVGLPIGVNAKRTYVLRDTGSRYELHFDSGIIHKFSAHVADEFALVEKVAHIDGREIAVASMAGVLVNVSDTTDEKSPRYMVDVDWSGGFINEVTYKDRTPGSSNQIVVTVAKDDEDRITSLSKSVPDFCVAVEPSEAITYGSGTDKITLTRGRADNVVTLVTTFPHIDPLLNDITETITFDDNGLIEEHKVSSQSADQHSTSITSYEYMPSQERYEANGAPKWAKITEVSNNLTGSWTKFQYYDEAGYKTGWLKKAIGSFEGSLASDGDESHHVVTEYSYDSSLSDNGNPEKTECLVERPRRSITKTLGGETARTYWKYIGSDQTVIRRAPEYLSPEQAGWGHANNLEFTVTRNTYCPSNVDSPTIDVTFGVGAAPDHTITVTATRKGPNEGTIDTAVTKANAFGYVENTSVSDTGKTISSMVATTDDSGFGRRKKRTYLNGLYTENQSWTWRGPDDVQELDKSRTTYEYSILGQVLKATHYPDGTVPSSRKIETTYDVDAMGNVVGTDTIATKPGKAAVTMSTGALYDILGRVTYTVDADAEGTSHAYSLPVGGVVKATTTFADSKQFVSKRYIGGLLKETYHNTEPAKKYPVSYDYGLEETQDMKRLWSRVSRNSGNEWTESYVNMIGQVRKAKCSATTRPATTDYDAKARPVKHVGFDTVETRTEYDPLRNTVSACWLDKNKNGQFDPGIDRKVSSSYQITEATNKHLWTTTVHSSTGNSVFTREVSLPGWDVRSKQNDRGWTQTVVVPGGTAGKWDTTTDYPDGTSTVSGIVTGELKSVIERKDDDTPMVTTLYDADPAYRTDTITERIGNTVAETITPGGLVNKINLPCTRFWQANQRDARQRITQQQRLDTGTQNMTYGGPVGEFTAASGAGVYPFNSVINGVQGHLEDLTTTGGPAAAKTHWTVHANSGLPDQKYLAYGHGEQIVVSDMGFNDKIQLVSDARPEGMTLRVAYFDGTEDVKSVHYDAPGEPDDITYALTRDDKGRPTTITGPLGTTTIAYNVDDQITSETLPHTTGKKVTREYDGNTGRPHKVRLVKNDGGGDVTILTYEYRYDYSGRPSGIESDGDRFSWDYLSDSHLPQNVSFGLDGDWANAKMSTVRTYGGTTDRTASFVTTTDSVTVYSATYADVHLHGVSYNKMDQVKEVTVQQRHMWPTATDGVDYQLKWNYTYDGVDQLTSAEAFNGGSAVQDMQFQFTSDQLGNRQSAVREGHDGDNPISHTTSYGSNIFNQIKTRSASSGAIFVSGYAPEEGTVWVNNKEAERKGYYYYLAITVDNTTGPVAQPIKVEYKVGEVVQFTRVYTRLVPKRNEQAGDRTYDDRGNLTGDSLFIYEWDALDRLIAVQMDRAGIDDEHWVRVEFQYDASHRRVKKTVKSWGGSDWTVDSVTKFVWDGWLLIAELNGSDQLVKSYVWGLDVSGTLDAAGGVGGLLGVRVHDPGSGAITASYYTARDTNGNVRALIDSESKQVVASYQYTPFGEPLTWGGAPNKVNICPFRFSTKYYDAEIGLYYYGYRYYDPSTGRWLNRDPIAESGGLNLYAFCGGDPVNYIDPLGLEGGFFRWVEGLGQRANDYVLGTNTYKMRIYHEGQYKKFKAQGEELRAKGDWAGARIAESMAKWQHEKAKNYGSDLVMNAAVSGAWSALAEGKSADALFGMADQWTHDVANIPSATADLVFQVEHVRFETARIGPVFGNIADYNRGVKAGRATVLAQSVAPAAYYGVALVAGGGWVLAPAGLSGGGGGGGAVLGTELVVGGKLVVTGAGAGAGVLTWTGVLVTALWDTANDILGEPKYFEQKGSGRGTTKTRTTKKGVPRERADKYWRKQLGRRRDLSSRNIEEIKRGRSPTVDDQWIRYHRKHAPYKGETIEIHHKGYGPKTKELPTTLHRGKGYFKKNHP